MILEPVEKMAVARLVRDGVVARSNRATIGSSSRQGRVLWAAQSERLEYGGCVCSVGRRAAERALEKLGSGLLVLRLWARMRFFGADEQSNRGEANGAQGTR
jgi:hypothetical protein